MKIVFSRKGFDSSAGGVPSPIINGQPVSIPIPADHRSVTTFGHLGLGNIVREITKGRYTESSLCHHDPMFERSKCAFGQSGAAQGHLAHNSVGIGDVFLFFGLFSNLDGSERHHRIFSYLRVEEMLNLGASPKLSDQPTGFSNQHPHTIGQWNSNNTIYLGSGLIATNNDVALRLTVEGNRNKVSEWRVPRWLSETGLSYHANRNRWGDKFTLQVVNRGQEFITDITGNIEAAAWLEMILTKIDSTKSH